MNLYTEQELIDKIKEIDKEIFNQMSMSEYQLGDGQGNQRVKYRPLKELYLVRDNLLNELSKLNPDYKQSAYSLRGNTGNRNGNL